MTVSDGSPSGRDKRLDSTPSIRPADRPPVKTVTTVLVLTLALQCAVPPFATDMYTPAFPQVTDDLAAGASLVGLTLTAFFIGLALGQLLGGPISDQRGRRGPLIAGGIICTIGGIGCALAQSIGILIAFRVVQGLGGGIAAVVARAVVVDVAKGDLLAKVMSMMMALGGLAPMIAPVAGGVVLTLGGTWRTVFWCLVGFGLLMLCAAILQVPESLPAGRRHGGGLRKLGAGLTEVLKIRIFVGYMLTSAFSAFTLLAYIANASFVLRGMKGMEPMPFALFFASTALAQIIVSVVNARLVGRFHSRTLIGIGLSIATLAVAALGLGVFALETPVVLTCVGFFVLMAVQGLIFGNSSALAGRQAPHAAGSASAVLGVGQAIAWATAAPLASSGGDTTAVPMVLVMIVGVAGSAFCYLVIARPGPVSASVVPTS